ncbi:MAG TPA: DUF4173 domain-containing protein [Gemmatimonadales bacterium]|nr:DUF4173 domain-containing protein [Gemmatimonadales bacterium]
MNPARAKVALLAALVLGAAGDIVLRAWPWGLGFVGLVALAVVAALATAFDRPFGIGRDPRDRDRVIALAATFVFALGLVLRDAPTLVAYNVLAMFTCAALATWPMYGRSVARFRVFDVVRALARSAWTAVTGAPVLALSDITWERPGASGGRRLRAATVGTLLAVPPVFVVGSLLAQADPMFGDFLTSWTRLGLDRTVEHAAVAAIIAWPAAGWLRGMAVAPANGRLTRYGEPTRLDYFGVAPALYALVGLLAAFLGLQARALFGGSAYVLATTGVTYAEYARRGFFELVAVSAIVLVLLLLGDWILDRRTPDADRRFRTMGWLLVALLAVLMASALQRMFLYVSFYGLSDTRLYATAGMAWVGVALGWFGWTILRGRRARFGVGLLVISAGWIATLNVINPEAVVVRVNLARAIEGHPFDTAYHARLSADAVPALLAAADRLPAPECSDLVHHLATRWHEHEMLEHDWRSWTLPVARAERLAGGSEQVLMRDHCPAVSLSAAR